ncbi:MAG: pilus assembly protein PilM [bacterium]
MVRSRARVRRPGTRPATTRRTARGQAAPRRAGRRSTQAQKKLGRKKRFSTAIDIGHYSVKIATVAVDDAGQARVQRATVQPLELVGAPKEENGLREAQVKALKAAIHQHGRLTGRIVLAIPRASTIIRYLKLPSSRRNELKEMVLLDAERHIPFSITEAEIDFEIIEKLGEHESAIMMVSAPRSEIDPLLDICREAGVIPEAVDVDILGACHAYRQSGDQEETKAVIDFGRESTCLGIISHGQILFTRSLSVGESRLLSGFPGAETWGDLRTRLAAIGALPPQDRAKVESWIGDLYVDLMRSVSAFVCEHPGSRVDRIILCGGGPYLPSGPSDTLSVRLKTKALVEQPLNGDLPSDSSYQGPELASAVGLALRSLQGNGQAINLLPSEMVAERERQEHRAFYKSAIFLGLLAVIFAGVGFYLKWEEKHSQLVDLRTKIHEIQPDISKLRQMEAKIDIVRTYLDREHSCLTVLSEILNNLPSQPPNNVSLNRIVFEKGKSLRLEGLVRSSKDVAQVNDILLEMGPQLLPGKREIFRRVASTGHTERDLAINDEKAFEFGFDCELAYDEQTQIKRDKSRRRLAPRSKR